MSSHNVNHTASHQHNLMASGGSGLCHNISAQFLFESAHGSDSIDVCNLLLGDASTHANWSVSELGRTTPASFVRLGTVLISCVDRPSQGVWHHLCTRCPAARPAKRRELPQRRSDVSQRALAVPSIRFREEPLSCEGKHRHRRRR